MGTDVQPVKSFVVWTFDLDLEGVILGSVVHGAVGGIGPARECSLDGSGLVHAELEVASFGFAFGDWHTNAAGSVEGSAVEFVAVFVGCGLIGEGQGWGSLQV